MNPDMQKRLKSFAWRTTMMVLAYLLNFAMENVTQIGLPPQYVPIAGLALGEVSKWLNEKYGNPK